MRTGSRIISDKPDRRKRVVSNPAVPNTLSTHDSFLISAAYKALPRDCGTFIMLGLFIAVQKYLTSFFLS